MEATNKPDTQFFHS